MKTMISLREFGRRHGKSLRAVQKAVASGRVTAVERGQNGRITGIDEALALEQWARSTNLVEAARNGKLPMQTASRTPNAPAALGTAITPAAGDQADYLAARARREGYAAERERLALARDRRELVAASELRPALETYVDDVIAIIEAIPGTYAPLLQETPDVEGKRQLLMTAMREIRKGLGNYEFSTDAGAAGNTEIQPAA